ncbi:HAMP domain-containing histidine kinase [Bacillus sp. EB106-08-02-XG196]|uniref:sensor histidine kinase n=1 Tax=Bacillus sp. EB106-08-02-XG196 TaxID=2737049 RepID=UPI0015C41C27|nr:HAMP domain-containing sensor histidine kinase [Bacillus sp. EB106-08-02-XG196]NWQ41309.1 HAMP domain-containing histidine kinase [Bacillus sp. EB106-08-02-XG196]
MKLRNKINLYTAFLFALLLLILNITVYYTFSTLLLDSELNTAHKEMKNISDNFGESLGKIPSDSLLRSYVPVNGMIEIVTEDNNNPPAFTSADEQNLSKRKSVFYRSEVSKTIEYQERSYTFESMPIIMQDGSVANLQIIKSMETATEILSILRLVLILVTLLALIPVIISSRLLSNFITKPVTSMIKTMTEIRKSGTFKTIKLEGKSKDELFQMGQTFNHMIDLLEMNFEKQEQFVSNASHELKTPLTIIESYASLLKRRGLTEPELFTESIEAIHSEALRMKEMTEQLLMLARHHEQWNIELNQVNLNQLIDQTVNAFKNAYKREIKFEALNEASIFIESDDKKLKQLLFIFLDNARKYSDDMISVELGKENDKIYIKIIDRGIGIIESELPKVFDRFYRVDKARSRKQGGSGLGLSLAKEIADAIGIGVQLDSAAGIGTTATLLIKKVEKL